MTRMATVEKLARDICWAGFTTPAGRAGHTKARYWAEIAPEARQDYIREAERLVWLFLRPGILDAVNVVLAERGIIRIARIP